MPSPFLGLMAWLAAGLVSLLGAFTFAELGAMFPGSGGQYLFLKESFGSLTGFLYGWTLALVIQPGSIAAVSIAFSQYLSAWIPMDPFGVKVVAASIVVFFTMINLLGVRRGAEVLNLLTSLKVLALIGLGLAGLFMPMHGTPLTGEVGSAASGFTASAFGVALIAAFWAFDGWNNVTFVAGEIRHPKRNIPLSLVIGILAVSSLYLLANYAYYRVLPLGTIAGSSFPAADAARVMGGDWAVKAVILAVLLSTLGCVNGMVLAGARVTYAMAEGRSLPRALAYVSPRFHVPSVTLILQMLWSVVLVFSGRYDQLFTYVVSAAFVFYGLAALALIVLRLKRPDAERPYRVPLYPVLPLAYLVFTVWFVFNACWEKPIESLTGLGIVLLGVPGYFVLKRRDSVRGSESAPAAEGAEA